MALHYVFDTPHDRVVWDVGHQGYGHKALTGRLEALRRIKKADGPSGFLRRSESPYDVFGAGHAGTSISAALGMAEAARRAGEDRQVVAVIGDGGATAGMAYEALNHAGHLGTPVRVIFNDNGMAIAPNVGGLAGTGHVRAFAESLGLAYAGPVDGHDLDDLLPALKALRGAPGPALLHVRTYKGRGFAPAEADPFGWHATTPFCPQSGERKSSSGGTPSWTAVFAEALCRVADRDPRVVAITAAMPDGTGLDRFAERHPDRVYDVGIAEQHAVTFAAGLAAEGLRPVCAIYSTFLQRAFDQIVHDVALQELPVSFALDRAGLVGADGPTHHGVLDLAYLRIDSQHGDRGAARRERAPAPAGHGDRVGPAVRAALPARGGPRRAHGPGAQAHCGGSRRAAAGGRRRGAGGPGQDRTRPPRRPPSSWPRRASRLRWWTRATSSRWMPS